MAHKIFSTGLSDLDKYVGGLHDGDALIFFISDFRTSSSVINNLLNYAILRNIPVNYISINDSYLPSLKNYQKINYLKVDHYRFKTRAFKSDLRKTYQKINQNGYLLLDDLSEWKQLFGSEKWVIEFFDSLTEISQKKNALLVCSALRSNFQVDSLAKLKDHATICLDLLTYGDKVFCQPLNLKGRYILHGIIPFELKEEKLRFEDRKPVSKIIQTELSEKKSNYLQELLHSSNIKYEQVFYKAPQAMIMFELGGDYREFNNRAAKLFGYSQEAIKLVNPLNLFPVSKRYAVMRWLVELREKKQATIQLNIVKRNNKTLPVELYASQITGRLYFCIIRDISEELKTFQSLQKINKEYEQLLEKAAVAIVVLYDNQILYANIRFIQLLRYNRLDDIKGKNINNLLTKDSMQRYRTALRKYSAKIVQPEKDQTTLAQTFEIDCPSRDGNILNFQVSLSEVIFQNKRCYQLSLFDITKDRSLIEQLQNRYNQYRNAVENSKQPIAIVKDEICIIVNKSFLEFFRFDSPEMIIGKSIIQVIDKTQKEPFQEILKKTATSKGKQSVFSFSMTRRDGSNLLCEVMLDTIADGFHGELIAYFSDKTEFEILQKNLIQKIEEMNLLKDTIPSLLRSLDIQKLLNSVLNQVIGILSWDIGAVYIIDKESNKLRLFYNKGFPKALSDKLSVIEIDSGIGGLISKTLTPHKISIDKYPSYLPFKSLFRENGVKTICFSPFVSEEKLVGMMILCGKNDIERTKFSEDLLSAIGGMVGNSIVNANDYKIIKESEEQKQILLESSPDVTYITSPTGAFLFVNSKIERLTGYSKKEFFKVKNLWLQLIHPDDKKYFYRGLQNLMNLEKFRLLNIESFQRGKLCIAMYEILPVLLLIKMEIFLIIMVRSLILLNKSRCLNI